MAAPPPPCACITYKYQGDCDHISTRVTQARTDLLPTTQEASLRLHAANSRLRTMATEQEKWGAWLAQDESRYVQTTAGLTPRTETFSAHPEFAAFWRERASVHEERIAAEEAFYGTPGGQEFLRQRAAEKVARMGYYTTDTVSVEEDMARYATERAQQAEQFTALTGQPAPDAETSWEPPQLMYGNGCSEKCRDFQWTGKCAHTDSALGRQRQLEDAVSQNREIRRFGAAMDREVGGTAKRGRLARMFGRGAK